jgi:hypothetical protein
MENRRQAWNRQQQTLRRLLANPEEHQDAMRIFLIQHALVHPAAVSGCAEATLEDEIWSGLPSAALRIIPPGEEHSLVWIFWHLTRIEDITMAFLAANQAQLLDSQDWLPRLQAPFRATGNNISVPDMQALNDAIDIDALIAYRIAVGQRTRDIAAAFTPAEMKRKPDPDRLAALLAQGDVIPDASGILDYWGGLKLSGLLLMPPTRHCFIHLNEAARLKKKVLKTIK